MYCKSDHAWNKEQEHRKELKISTENGTAASFLFILARQNTLHDELVGTPVPETDHRRADESTEPRILGVIVVTYEVDHSVAILINLDT